MLLEYLTKLSSKPEKVPINLGEPSRYESKEVILAWYKLLPESHQQALVESSPGRIEGEEPDCYLKRIHFRKVIRQKYGLGLND